MQTLEKLDDYNCTYKFSINDRDETSTNTTTNIISNSLSSFLSYLIQKLHIEGRNADDATILQLEGSSCFREILNVHLLLLY